MVTLWKKSAFNDIGMDPIEHNQRYARAYEYMRILYKLRLPFRIKIGCEILLTKELYKTMGRFLGWWCAAAWFDYDKYIDPSKVRHINHQQARQPRVSISQPPMQRAFSSHHLHPSYYACKSKRPAKLQSRRGVIQAPWNSSSPLLRF